MRITQQAHETTWRRPLEANLEPVHHRRARMDAVFARPVAQLTTTSMKPKAIREPSLAYVARIGTEMNAVIERTEPAVGYASSAAASSVRVYRGFSPVIGS